MGHDDDQVQSKSWNINHYILAGLCATLIVSAVITIVSVVLSPPQVTFSVVRATGKTMSDGTNLMVTLEVYNPSRRCEARYQSVFIKLRNSSTGSGKVYLNTNVVPNIIFPMHYVRGPNVTLVNSTYKLLEKQNGRDNGFVSRLISGDNFTVEVRAEVRFKIGVTPTRLYDMTVFCHGVQFIDDNSPTAQANQQHYDCRG